ncbi:hypothetical protein SCHPADRAFT_212284 [Schizopora paradoxa]|uniref:DUF6533 domain-containing protein n=1 Tax=Schizopora paradoxa TaxID=27342 RepID=A0A0H2RXD3_9AGAM|nr:hypothetical protein SCHPADRAFT_212284 [Schizopora paradoxa]
MASNPLDHSIWDTFVFRYTIIATTCFVVYEHLINFDSEVRFLWMRRFTFGSCLLFACRYLPIAQICVATVEYVLTNDLSPSNCNSLLKANSSLVFLQYCLSIVVVYTRAYVVWACSKRVFASLLVACSLSGAGSAYAVYRFVRGIQYLGPHPWPGCIFLVTDQSIFYALIGGVFVDSFALCLLLYKSVQHTREMKNVGFHQVSLLTVMAQEGMTYFLLNIVCTLANTIVLQRASENYRDFLMTYVVPLSYLDNAASYLLISHLFTSTQCCIQNVLCARLFFHTQNVHRRTLGISSISTTRMHTDIHFAEFDVLCHPSGTKNVDAEDVT